MSDAELLKKLEALTEEERKQVMDYIEFLLERERHKEGNGENSHKKRRT